MRILNTLPERGSYFESRTLLKFPLTTKQGALIEKIRAPCLLFSENVAHLHLYFSPSPHSPILKSGELAKAVMEG